MRCLGIIQARMGSERLPGKVLRPLLARPMLDHVLRRAAAVPGVEQTIVATSTAPIDDRIEEWGAAAGVTVFRGSEDDVLDRYVQAALPHSPTAVMRITADCPLLDPEVSQRVLDAFWRHWPAVDYAVNVGYPRGLDTEVVSLDALGRAHTDARDAREREHVTLHIWRRPEIFRVLEVRSDGPDLSGLRWTVDTEEDFAFVQAVFEQLGDSDFGWEGVLGLVTRHPALAELNRHVRQKEC
jgi:spore coat polysaccharide biosynthesis protein SpsF